ncbi:MAG TPA: tetratricopeptide repeat protein [bacterium]|nr:tetratricopeptide repeat protein [bacterium]
MKTPARKKLLIWSTLTFGSLGGLFLGSIFTSQDRPQDWMKYRYSVSATANSAEVELGHYEQKVQAQPGSASHWAGLAAAQRKAGKRSGDGAKLEQARVAAEKSLALLPHFNPAARLVLAQLAQDRHDFPTALALAEQILRESPQNPQAISVKVSSNLALGRTDAAREDAEYLARRFPGLPSLTMRALLALEDGREREALADFEKAIRSEDFGDREGSAWVRSLLGRHYLRQGNLKTARFLLGEALRIQPETPLAMGLLAELEAKAGNLEQAESLYRRAYQILPEPSFRVDLGAALAAAGRRAEAEALWAEAEIQMRLDLETNPYGHRGEMVHLLLNRADPADFPEALRLAEAEAEIRKNRETMETLAWAHEMAASAK